MNELFSKLEALLFIYGEPMEFKKITKVLNRGESSNSKITEETIKEALEALSQKLSGEAERGTQLVFSHDRVQLVTKPEFSPLLESVIKEELNEILTPAALETLAIVAYAGSITRSFIDYIRGVNSSFILRTLLLRGLVDRVPDPKRTNAYLYRPSFDFLKHIGLSKPEDLPDFEKFKDLISKLKINE